MTGTIAAPAPEASPLGTFERYLSLWVALAILAGLALGLVTYVVTRPLIARKSRGMENRNKSVKVLFAMPLAIFGAVVFGLLGIAIGAGRARIPALVFLDAIAPGMLIAQATGRLGNYFNQDLFGAPTTLPWGLQVDPGNPAIPPGLPPDTLFHPLFLYEILWNLLGLVVILMIERIARRRGRVLTGSGTALGLYLLWYGAGRAWLESIRLDPSELLIGGVKVNILAALLAAAVGVAIVVRASRRPGGRADDEAVSADADRAGTR